MWHKEKWKRNNDKHLVKIAFEDIADKDGQDMVDVDKLYIHIIDTLNCLWLSVLISYVSG